MGMGQLNKLEHYFNPLRLQLMQAASNIMNPAHMQKINAKIQSLAKNINPLKAKAHTQQDVSVKMQGSYTATASVQSQRTGNVLNVLAQYNASGNTASQLNSNLSQTQNIKVNQGQPKPGYANQTIQLDQSRNVLSNSSFDLARTVDSTIVSNAYQKVGGSIRETSITTNTNQDLSRLQNTNAVTETMRNVSNTDNKGNVVGNAFSHTIVNQETSSALNQNTVSSLQRDVLQDTTISKANIAGVAITKTQIDTQDTRSGSTNIQTNSLTDYAATVTRLNQEGQVIGVQDSNRVSESNEDRNIVMQQNINTEREILSLAKGQERVSLDTQKTEGQLTQNTNAAAATVVTNLAPDGSTISTQAYLTNTASTLNQSTNTDINRIVNQDAAGVRGAGELSSKVVTDIDTRIESTAPNGNVAVREIERNIQDQNSAAWAGAIELTNLEGGGRLYSLKNVDVGSRVINDVTKEGVNELRVNTDTATAKMVSGSVQYQPAEQVTPVGNVAGAGVGISFATYSGIASSFKLDTGEVNFSFSFASSEITSKETAKSVDGELASEATALSGQKNQAQLEGKLTSTVLEDGSRLITVNAAYDRSGLKMVTEGEKKGEFAQAEQDTNVQLQGTILVSKNGEVKTVESSFDMFKTEDSEASGTSVSAVKNALAQTDPLRKNFYFDNGTLRFNLGFATLNFSVYA